jgi:hypothetical protein
VIEVPRSLLPEFLKMPESDQVARYFLVNQSEDGTQKKVYIGQSGDLQTRLPTHNKEKEFWEKALILISLTKSLTNTHVQFLEWHCLEATRKAGRFNAENSNGGSKPHTPPPLEADCLEIYETGKILIATLGYILFDPVVSEGILPKADELFICKSSGANGTGLYTQEGFVVLKGSTGRKENVPSIIGTAHENFRKELLAAGVMREEGDSVIFQKDHLFRSPSMAAVALTGRTANGWLEWKSKDGKTLDELKRQTPIPPAELK